MKIKRERFVLFISIFAVILLSGIGVVSADSCSVMSRDSCDADKIIIGISAMENAHIQVWHHAAPIYDYALCCDFAGTRDCIDSGPGKNHVLGIADWTNAHASSPNTGYGGHVCYGDLACDTSSTSCPTDYPLEVLSLTALENAHVGEFSKHAIKLCCKRGGPTQTCGDGTIEGTEQCEPGPPLDLNGKTCADVGFLSGTLGCFAQGETNECQFDTSGCVSRVNSVYWANSAGTEIDIAEDRDTVRLVFNIPITEGQVIHYEIKEDDLVGDDHIKNNSYTVTAADVTANLAYDRWVVEWIQDVWDPISRDRDPEYYFNISFSGTTLASSNLKVHEIDDGGDPYCDNSKPAWVFPDSSEIDSSDNCYDPNVGDCCLSGDTCNRGTGHCESGVIQIQYCGNYTSESDCDDYEQDVAERTIALAYNGHNCEGDNVIEWNPYTFLTDCKCDWKLNQSDDYECMGDVKVNIDDDDENIHITPGSCTINDGTADSCDDGYLTTSWTGIWTWDDANEFDSLPDFDVPTNFVLINGKYYYDPIQTSGKSMSTECKEGGTRTIPCASQLRLSFFTWQNLIAALIIIMIIYIIINLKKPKKRR